MTSRLRSAVLPQVCELSAPYAALPNLHFPDEEREFIMFMKAVEVGVFGL